MENNNVDDNTEFYKQLCVGFFSAHPELPMIQEVWNILVDWIADHKLTVSRSNLETAFRVNQSKIEKTIDSLPAAAYRERVVEPEFKRRKSAEPKPRESERPFGVRSWSEWIHSR
ncbi:MAG: hypothetical protein WAQ52_08710 [Terriglobales bacterium]